MFISPVHRAGVVTMSASKPVRGPASKCVVISARRPVLGLFLHVYSRSLSFSVHLLGPSPHWWSCNPHPFFLLTGRDLFHFRVIFPLLILQMLSCGIEREVWALESVEESVLSAATSSFRVLGKDT